MIVKAPKWILFGGGVLAFCAGMVNVISLMGFFHQGVTHATGNVSRMAIAMNQGNLTAVCEIAGILFFFLFGAMISGIIVRDGHLKLGRRYGWVLALESLLLFIAAAAFGKGLIVGELLASMASGLQNAMASTYSGAIIRTTHLTGVLTDLGAAIGHLICGVKVDARRFKIYILLIGSFFLGGFLGAQAFLVLNIRAMLIPAALIGFSSIIYFHFRRLSLEEKTRACVR